MTPRIDRPILTAAYDLEAALADLGITPTFIGGVAVSLLSQPRYTEDLDALIVFDTANTDTLLDILVLHGFTPRFSGMAELARKARMITVRHESTGTAIDIALGCMPFESEVQERATSHEVSGISIRLPTPEDLVIMKAIANRPKDREDIREIAISFPNLDRSRIHFWVEQYAELLENPNLWSEVEALLANV